jgi:hypothetical protein
MRPSDARFREPAAPSFQSQVVPPEFFALNATNGAIGNLFLRRAIIDHMDRKSAAQVAECSNDVGSGYSCKRRIPRAGPSGWLRQLGRGDAVDPHLH